MTSNSNRIIEWTRLSLPERKTVLSRPAMSDNSTLSATVRDIVQAVKMKGDKALFDFAKRFDGIELDDLRLSQSKIEKALASIDASSRQAIDLAYDNIKRFHQAQIPQDVEVTTQAGVVCQLKHVPLEKVGLYIPGGTAPLPSTVLMLGVSAQVAGCKQPILCSPANKFGSLAPEIVYAAQKCGIQDIFCVGGAQAIAAMAYGTESIPSVDKIYGPGNSYVTEAKQQVSLAVDGAAIDMPAGPSEVLVIADTKANPAFVASDLLSQAEHGSDSQTVLLSDSLALLKQVEAEVQQQLQCLSRKAIAEQAMANSRFILCHDIQTCIEVSNAYAPEHLIIQTEEADKLLKDLRNAGSIFVGAYSPESAGDYASGTNHVLPTYGYARNYSSLGVLDFMRRYTIQKLSAQGLKTIGPAIMRLAEAEGLDAHLNAVKIRLDSLGDHND